MMKQREHGANLKRLYCSILWLVLNASFIPAIAISCPSARADFPVNMVPAHPQLSEPSENSPAVKAGFQFEKQDKRVRIGLDGKSIVDFVFRDDKILRPYFANAKLLNGLQVTRNHPPVKGVDQPDHANMHPGIWLAFGDINGFDFWRNKAKIEHVRFVKAPAVVEGRLKFATECQLKDKQDLSFCRMTNEYTLASRPHGWLLIWSAEFQADNVAVTFGDQEEMGFGARMATPFIEKNGGIIRSSTGRTSAKKTWGQPA
ncbi:MAG: DUF6807 family protein, partial [Planctomycetota bacterium]